MTFWFSATVWAYGLPDRPEPPRSVEGECTHTVAISINEPIPASLTGPDGKARCSAIVEPRSSYADLLLLEEHLSLVEKLYVIDVAQLQAELDYERKRSAWLEAELARTQVWYLKPWAQRAIGGATVAASVGLAAYGLSSLK